MNNNAYLSMFESSICFAIAMIVLFRNTKDSRNKACFYFFISVSIGATIEFLYLIAETREIARFWIQMSSIFYITESLALNFYLTFTNQALFGINKKVRNILVFAPGFFFAVCSTIPGLMWLDPGDKINYSLPIRSPDLLLFNISLIWNLLVGLLSLIICYNYFSKQKMQLEKGQTKYIFYANLFPLIIGISCNVLFPFIGGFEIPISPNFWFLIGCFFIFYAMIKFELFALTIDSKTEKIIATIAEAIFLVDTSGRIISANQAASELLGYEPGELKEKILIDISKNWSFASEEIEELKTNLLLLPEIISNVAMNVITKDGNKKAISLSKSSVKDRIGETRGYLFVLTDLTSVLQIEHIKIEERELVTQEFIAKFSDELRNPLNAIIGFSELLLDQQLGSINEPQKETLQDIYGSAKVLLIMIEDMLTIEDFKRDAKDTTLEWFSVKDILREIQNYCIQSNKKKNHLISFDIEDENLQLFSEKVKLNIGLKQLIANAIKFTPAYGKITISICTKSLDDISFTIADNGIGIKNEDKVNVFKKFWKSNPEIEGTGLGLVIAKHAIEQLGGNLQFESKLGEGTKFFFNIPRKVNYRNLKSNR